MSGPDRSRMTEFSALAVLEQFAIRPDFDVIRAFHAPPGFRFARVISF
jgi:hypothetical protein